MKKILLSIFLAVSMLLTNISVIAEKNAEEKYDKAVEFLSALNVISVDENNKDFSAQAYVTREEFCMYISRAFKFEPSKNAREIFSDVSADSELSRYISALYDRGVVSGYGGAFRPRDIITYNEAIKLLVSIMNYDYSNEVGGYPSGYLSIASSIGITEGVYGVERLTKGATAQLIYNAMTAPVMEITGFKDGQIICTTNDEKSILTELYDVYEGDGIVMATKNASFTSGTASLESNEVLIGTTEYNIGKVDVKNLLGHYIKFLYQEIDEEEFEIILVLEDNSEEFIINSNQIIDFEGYTYRYEDENGKTKKIRLNSDFLLMYNFDYPISGFNADMMKPDNGRIKFIKRGNNSGYSAVIIEDCDTHIVSDLDVARETIYTKDKESINLRSKDYTIIDAEGKDVALSSLKEWSVVSVLKSIDGKKITIYVSEGEFVGRVTKLDQGYPPKIEVDSKEYRADKDVMSNIELGKEYTFYLDYCGNIAGVDMSTPDGLRYAYLISAKINDSYGADWDERVVVRLFDEDGTEKKYPIAEKVTINDVFYKELMEEIEKIDAAENEKVEDKIKRAIFGGVNIFKYELNSSGEIKNLYVFDRTNKYIREMFNGTAYWNLKQRSFDGKVTMESDVPVFIIPVGYEVADYEVADLSYFPNDRTATVKIYTMGDNVYGDVILMDVSGDESYERPLAIVEKVKHTLDEYGDPCVKVTLLYDGSKQEFEFAKEELLGDIGYGDIIEIGFDQKNKIQSIRQVYDYSRKSYALDKNPYEPRSDAKYRSHGRSYYGYAYDVTDGLLRYCMTIPTGNTEPDMENALLSGFRIYVVEGTEIRIGSENDIKGYTQVGGTCSEIIVHTAYGDPVDIVVIKA